MTLLADQTSVPTVKRIGKTGETPPSHQQIRQTLHSVVVTSMRNSEPEENLSVRSTRIKGEEMRRRLRTLPSPRTGTRTHVHYLIVLDGFICNLYVLWAALGPVWGQAAYSNHYHSSHCGLMMFLQQPARLQPFRCRRYENAMRRNNAKSLRAKKLRVGWELPTQALCEHPRERTLSQTHSFTNIWQSTL